MMTWPTDYTTPRRTSTPMQESPRDRHKRQLTAAMTALSDAIAGGQRMDPRSFIESGLDPAMPGVTEMDTAMPGVGYDEAMPTEAGFDEALPAEEAALPYTDSEGYAPPALDVDMPEEPAQNQTSQGDEGGGTADLGATAGGGGGSGITNEAMRAAKKGLRNGYVPRERLEGISGANPGGGQGYLLDVAAGAWEAMRRQAASDGVALHYSSTYRSYGTQKASYDDYKAGNRGPGVVVAPPGRSQHGWGLAVDVSDGKGIVGKGTAQWKWLARNAARFGWYGINSESWHWEFRGTA